ncbi:hypothetical protein B9Z55_006994 [Caenorhabditis nigoni]|uniref:F-box associated domain-containing protein n=1 Tax=Caenorhabditis nigoni TaxID=1611254 RepID=A0A2G5V7L6_9PELO|nr:hypothetical protein B9Z55_006994 [Caenorhabditis nigoni]
MQGVSYPALRSVLEHIKANCRLPLSARCPKISRIEKSIPLRVDKICFMENGVRINDVKYEVCLEYPKLAPIPSWPIYISVPKHPLTLRLYNYKSDRSIEKKFSRNYIGVEIATRKIVEYLLGGRNHFRVQCLTIFNDGYETMQYLFGLSIMKVSVLKNWKSGLPEFHPLVERSPLKELHFEASHPTDFENPIVRTAEKIIIRDYEYHEPDLWLETHRNLPNKEVIIDTVIEGLTDISILDLIEYWKETRKPVGSSLSFHKSKDESYFVFLEKVMERFQGHYVKWKETNAKAVSIKVDSKSEIVVYGYGAFDEYDIVLNMVIKVVAVKSSAEKLRDVVKKLLNYSAFIVLPFVLPFFAVLILIFIVFHS